MYFGIQVITPDVRSPSLFNNKGGRHVSVPDFKGGDTITIPTVYGAMYTRT